MEGDVLKNSLYFPNRRSIMIEIWYVNQGCKDCFAELLVLACDAYNKKVNMAVHLLAKGALYTPIEKIWMK
jgi:hypothetical protein